MASTTSSNPIVRRYLRRERAAVASQNAIIHGGFQIQHLPTTAHVELHICPPPNIFFDQTAGSSAFCRTPSSQNAQSKYNTDYWLIRKSERARQRERERPITSRGKNCVEKIKEESGVLSLFLSTLFHYLSHWQSTSNNNARQRGHLFSILGFLSLLSFYPISLFLSFFLWSKGFTFFVLTTTTLILKKEMME
jgi:hypothetical protein